MFSFLILLSTSKKQCEECKSLGRVLENAIKKNIPKDQFSQLTIQNCNKLPRVLQGKCHAFARKNIDTLLKSIESGTSADETCAKLHFCKTLQEEKIKHEAQEGDWKEHKPQWSVSWTDDI